MSASANAIDSTIATILENSSKTFVWSCLLLHANQAHGPFGPCNHASTVVPEKADT